MAQAGDRTQERLMNREYVYVTNMARVGYHSYLDIMTGKQTVGELTAKLDAYQPKTDEEAISLRYMRRGIELAQAGRPKYLNDDHVWQAMIELDNEIYPTQPVEREPQEETCHHGVSFKATCVACDAEF